MAQTATNQSAREASLARRRALATTGKAALTASTGSNMVRKNHASSQPATASTAGGSAREASRARREAMSVSGKAGIKTPDRTRQAAEGMAPSSSQASPVDVKTNGCGCGCNGSKASCDSSANTGSDPVAVTKRVSTRVRSNVIDNTARAASLARRKAMSTRGKAGINTSSSSAQTARAANPGISSRELAKALREQRSRKGKTSDNKSQSHSQPAGRMRKNSKTGAAQDASWKVGESETSHGQTLTGSLPGRSQKVTGDEPGTCRTVTGTDYMGADIFRTFCQGEPGKSIRKVEVTSTSHGNAVSGNRIGRGKNVTGDEPGTCQRVTGNEYVNASHAEQFCGGKTEVTPGKVTNASTRKGKTLTGNNVGRSEKVTGDETGSGRELTGSQYMQPGNGTAPAKVGVSSTLRGGSISGTMVGRNQRVTGDEPGSCRNITGDDYIGQEQYSGFCNKTPQPKDRKVGVSSTLTGKSVTGTLTDRSGKVTGDEPGTCKAVTGTPYASADQYTKYCKPEEASIAAARTRQQRGTPGTVMTGNQPGIAGKMTGDNKGACENVSGTPYVGADQFAQACPATAAETTSPDFPQPMMGNTPWGDFSVNQPSGGAQHGAQFSNVTGSQYEQGHITGPFGMAAGKVTGTEQARFDNKTAAISNPVIPATSETIEGRVKSRISGEGMDAGARITGDDWDRGDNVTGTEGLSATRRNPTIRSSIQPVSVMQSAPKRNEDIQNQVSKVTGGSGNTEKGSLITYSGGARG